MRTVEVVGLGYIGLPTAAMFASHGLQVIGVDINPATVATVNAGLSPIAEPDLPTYLATAVRDGQLVARATPAPADAFIIAVPTPYQEGHAADLSYIAAAARSIAPHLAPGNLVILESTSPPGTTRHLASRLMEARPDLSLDGADGRPALHVAYCPERVIPGRTMVELVTNSRVVGGLTPQAAELARDLYATFVSGDIAVTDTVTAELTKLAENSFRDVNIAFANELAGVAERLGADPWEVIALANRHPRVSILQPGPGVGGHCIAVDPWFIVEAAPDLARLVRTAREVNDAQPNRVVGAVTAAVAGLARPQIAALGLAFKADVDDLCDSPAVTVVERLAAALPTADIRAVEPHATALPEPLAGAAGVRLTGLDEALAGADLAVVLTDHSEFRAPAARAAIASAPAVVDTRGLLR
ncbi:MAG: UDP-N-acetyl-D-mannosamine dehydrogenase [Propionibacteriaceae bacterium]|nr:UDP-N-acetyl-D-mannosamine dehydrogenase [Propionibacteriaceae bacterium]